ncbi:MAG: M24 family metallopeptidase [Candidatus Bathyarchaeia archaeon]
MNIYEDRVRRFQQIMREKKVDGYMILTEPDYMYFMGEYRHQPRAFIPKEGDPFIIAFEGELKDAQSSSWVKQIRTFKSVAEMMRKVHDLIRELGYEKGTIAVELFFGTPTFLLERFKKINPQIKIVDSQEIVSPLRMIKSSDELEIMRKTAELAQVGLKRGLDVLREGVTENDVAAEIEYAYRKAGTEGVSIPTFVNSGVRSGWLHGFSTSKVIRKGELVLIDVMPMYGGYRGDLARMAVIGSADARKKQMYETYLKAREAALDIIKPQVGVSALDDAAAQVFKHAGLDEYFVRGIAHGLGLNFEETPASTINPADAMVQLQSGMVLSVGHSVLSIPGVGGVRLEDMVLVKEDGYEFLTRFPNELNEIGP